MSLGMRALLAGVGLWLVAVACTLQPPPRSKGAGGGGGADGVAGGLADAGKAGRSSAPSAEGGSFGMAAGGEGDAGAAPTTVAGNPGVGGSNGSAGEPAGEAGATGSSSCEPPCPNGASCEKNVCVCSEGYAFCDGSCIDVRSDPKNCGACKHTCDACSLGRCFQTLLPETGSGSDFRPIALAISSTHVYYTTAFGVGLRRLPRTGGAAETIVPGENGGKAQVVGNAVYWADEGLISNNGTIHSLPMGAGAAVELAKMEVAPHELTVGGGNVYWLNHYEGPLMKVSVAGGMKTTVTSKAEALNATNLLNDGTNLYWASEVQGGSIVKMPMASGTPSTMVSNLPNVFYDGAMALSGGALYFLDQPAGHDPELAKLDTTGGVVKFLVSITAYSVAADADGVYVGGHSGIYRADLDGKHLTLLSVDSNFARLYVDGDDLFWITSDGAIRVMSKTP